MDYLDIAVEIYLREELRPLPHLTTQRGRISFLSSIINNKQDLLSWILSTWFAVTLLSTFSLLSTFPSDAEPSLIIKFLILPLLIGILFYGWTYLQIYYLARLSSLYLNDPSWNNPRW